jgi:hypothetical protein
MTPTSRRASRLVPALFCLVLAVLGGRQLAGTATRATIASPDGATLSSASDTGFLAVASRTPVQLQDGRLQLGAVVAAGLAALAMLAWTDALVVRRRLVRDLIGVRFRRRGPPSSFGA